MADPTWYREGTVAVTNGQTAVVGTGTVWATESSPGSGAWTSTKAYAGDALKIGDVLYEIASVTDATHLTLRTAYAGTTNAASAYAIVPCSDLRNNISQALSEVSTYLNRTRGVMRLLLVSGTPDAQLGSTGDMAVWPAGNLWWIKQSATDWGAAQAFATAGAYLTQSAGDARYLQITNYLYEIYAAGSSAVAQARVYLGLGTMALQNATAVAITGGTIAGVTISTLAAALGLAYGGTGANLTTLSDGALLKKSGAAIVAAVAGTDYLTTNQTITHTGDVTGSGTTSIPMTIASGAVTNAKQANMTAGTVKANVTGGLAAPTDATPSQVLDLLGSTQGQILYRGASTWAVLAPGSSGQVLTTGGTGANPLWANAPAQTIVHTGDVTGTGTTSIALTIAANAVTNAKMATMATGTIKANVSGVTAVPSDVTPGQVLDLIGSTQGQILYRSGTGWTVLAPGGSGQALVTGGSSANPSWATVGSVTSVGLSLPAIFTVTGSPVTGSGTLTATFASQSANTIFAGPTTGSAAAPTFRALVGADLPTPTTSTLGGVKAAAPVTNQWLQSLDTLGNFVLAQPAFANLSGQATLAQLPSIAANTVLANISGVSAVPIAATASQVLDTIASTRGQVLFRGASGWTALSPGAVGQVLSTNGTGADPTWTTVSGTGTVTSISTSAGLSTGTSGSAITGSGTVYATGRKPGGRLTLTSGTPVLTTTVTAAATIYYSPYDSSLSPVWNDTAADFVLRDVGELSQALSDATKSPAAAAATQVYDIFLWDDAGTYRISRGPTWASGTGGSNTVRGTGAGSTALTRVKGLLVNSVAITNGPGAQKGLYLGTIMTDDSGATCTWNLGSSAAGGGAAWLGVYNYYNRCIAQPTPLDSTVSHTYQTATMRMFDNNAGNRVTFVRGMAEDGVFALFSSRILIAAAGFGYIAIGLDSTTTSATGSNQAIINITSSTAANAFTSQYSGDPGIGRHYLQALEQGDGTNANTFYGGVYEAFVATLRM